MSMAWDSLILERSFMGQFHRPIDIRPFKMNEQCFVRPDHECGKVFGASKSCFIACPSDDELEPILALISEKLQKSHIEPIIAVKERAYGKDIFCTKICGKIIESKFCLTILNDTIKDGVNVPNPNVYFEYGLMTALKKYIIPLQKEELKLAFNIQSHDTIKYNPKNLSIELDRAIRDAIYYTDNVEKKDLKNEKSVISTKGIIRDFEIAGFVIKDRDWFLNDIIGDTHFRGFGHDENKFYVYLGLIDSLNDCETYLDDLNILLYRTEKRFEQLQQGETQLKDEIAKFSKTMNLSERTTRGPATLTSVRAQDHITRLDEKLTDNLSKQTNLKTLYVGFVNRGNLDITEFEKNCSKIISEYPRVVLVVSTDDQISFGNVIVNLKAFKSST
jgi:hypothetical protein